jgi:dihydroneopterin aldolase
VSYADVCDVIKQEMEIPSCLLEHVCGRIVQRLFQEFPAIESVDLKLSKCTPPMNARADTASVEVHCEAPQRP